jgi:hypothetical protein
MQRRNREINIFSMSALDLFASAMGAFILIAIVLFPYFPNTGASEVDVAELRGRIDQLREEREAARERAARAAERAAEAEAESKALEEQLAKAAFPDVDLVIALDITTSMKGEIDGLKREITQLIRILDRLAPSVAAGVVAYGDREWDEPLVAQRLDLVTGSAARLNRLVGFVEGLEAGMGVGGGGNPDPPELLRAAIAVAADMPWRSDAGKRVIVAITDATAYPEEQSATERVAGRFAADGGMVSVVGPEDLAGNRAVAGALRAVADAGRGRLVPGGGSVASTVLLALL